MNVKDLVGGILLLLIGVFIYTVGRGYRLGSLSDMGPGYFPILLGIILAFTGLCLAVTSFVPASQTADEESEAMPLPDLRGGVGIIAAIVAFIFSGSYLGLAPATFLCVAIAASGDRNSTLKGTLLLATGATIFSVILFSMILNLSIPIVRGINVF